MPNIDLQYPLLIPAKKNESRLRMFQYQLGDISNPSDVMVNDLIRNTPNNQRPSCWAIDLVLRGKIPDSDADYTLIVPKEYEESHQVVLLALFHLLAVDFSATRREPMAFSLFSSVAELGFTVSEGNSTPTFTYNGKTVDITLLDYHLLSAILEGGTRVGAKQQELVEILQIVNGAYVKKIDSGHGEIKDTKYVNGKNALTLRIHALNTTFLTLGLQIESGGLQSFVFVRR
jgi:hypothetical protein